jgi:hypothetical protein
MRCPAVIGFWGHHPHITTDFASDVFHRPEAGRFYAIIVGYQNSQEHLLIGGHTKSWWLVSTYHSSPCLITNVPPADARSAP